MTDDQLDGISQKLLRGLDRLRKLELRKRATARSTDEFHGLAEDVEAESAEVFRVARQERQVGDNDSPDPVEQREQDVADWTEEGVPPEKGRRPTPPS